MEYYKTEEEYLEALEKRGMLPDGFSCAVRKIVFFPRERAVTVPLPMDISMIMLDKPTEVFGAVFTRNSCPGAPVIIGKNRLQSRKARGILINNKIANVCTATGLSDSSELLNELAVITGGSADEFFPASTGIIGWHLPVREIREKLPELAGSLEKGSAVKLAKGIMTTDSYPKLRSAETGSGRILAVAKGAGMIEPNMATMLSFIMTDIDIGRKEIREILSRVVDKTYNSISVDGDQSTSDTVIIMSSCLKKGTDSSDFESALAEVCSKLAEDIVRNAEGTGHVIRVRVEGAESNASAKNIGKAVVNSPLVGTAVFGNDPNVGRLLSAIGDYMGNSNLDLDTEQLKITLGKETVFENSAFTLDQDKEAALAVYLKERALDSEYKNFPAHDLTVDIGITVSREGRGEAEVLGTDLSYGYVRENADYRS